MVLASTLEHRHAAIGVLRCSSTMWLAWPPPPTPTELNVAIPGNHAVQVRRRSRSRAMEKKESVRAVAENEPVPFVECAGLRNAGLVERCWPTLSSWMLVLMTVLG